MYEGASVMESVLSNLVEDFFPYIPLPSWPLVQRCGSFVRSLRGCFRVYATMQAHHPKSIVNSLES